MQKKTTWPPSDREHGRRQVSLDELAGVMGLPDPATVKSFIERRVGDSAWHEAFHDALNYGYSTGEAEEQAYNAKLAEQDVAFRTYANAIEKAANEVLWDYGLEVDEIPNGSGRYYLAIREGGAIDALQQIELFVGEQEPNGYYDYVEDTGDDRPTTEALLFGAWRLPFEFRVEEAMQEYDRLTDFSAHSMQVNPEKEPATASRGVTSRGQISAKKRLLNGSNYLK